MRPIHHLTRQELGDAIVRYIGKREGETFLPYRIKSIGRGFPNGIDVELEFTPMGSLTKNTKHNLRVK